MADQRHKPATDVAFSRYQLYPEFRYPAYALLANKPQLQPLKILMGGCISQ
jgi:hypothetical protein